MLAAPCSLLLFLWFSLARSIEFQNNRMVDQSIHSCHGCHWILEDLVTFRKHQVTANPNAAPFISRCQKGEENFHFLPGLLNVSEVIKDNYLVTIEFLQHGIQFQISFRSQ